MLPETKTAPDLASAVSRVAPTDSHRRVGAQRAAMGLACSSPSNQGAAASLFQAAEAGPVRQLSRMVERCSKSQLEATDAQGSTAVTRAVVHSNLRTLQVLIGAGASVNTRDKVRAFVSTAAHTENSRVGFG